MPLCFWLRVYMFEGGGCQIDKGYVPYLVIINPCYFLKTGFISHAA